MKETINSKIVELRDFLFKDVPEIIAADDFTMEKYLQQVRAPLNAMIIEIAMGLSLERAKGEEKFKFSVAPTMSDIADLASLLEEFEEKIERPFYTELEDTNEDTDDDSDMNIPAATPQYIKQQIFTDVKHLSKKKVMQEYQSRISMGTIKSSHLYQLYEAGIKLRKKRLIITSGMILGVLAAVGITTAIVINAKHKKNEQLDDSGSYIDVTEEVTGDADDSTDSDIPETDDDIPQVVAE